MLVQSLQNASLFSGIFSVSGKSKEGTTDSFSTLFAQLSANTSKSELFVQNTSPDNNVSSADAKADLTTNETKEIGKTALSERVSTEKPKSPVEKQTAAADRAKATEPSEEATEEIIESFQACVNVITVYLNISADELKDFMSDYGFQPSDLMNSENVKAVFVSFECQGDISMLLTDSSLLDKCNELMGQVSDILSSLEESFGNTSDFVKLLSDTLDNKGFDKLLLKDNNKAEDSAIDPDAEYDVGEKKADDSDEAKEMSIDFKKDASHEGTFKSVSKTKDKAHFTNNDAADRFMDNIQNVFTKGIEDISDRVEAAFQIRNIADQILDSVKVLVKADTTSVEIQLTPEHLGKVNVSVEDNNGVITAKFRTENELSKEAIENNINQFKETLREQGIKVDKVEVSVSDFSFAKNDETKQNSQEEQGSKNKRHFTLEQINEKVDGKDLNDTLYIEQGYSTVTYQA